MIVTLKYVVSSPYAAQYLRNYVEASVGTLLCEVNNEEEAFAEMRRFLKVNRISSDVTYVKMIEERELKPRHKEVSMCLEGCQLYNRSENKDIRGVTFGIYYGADRPRYKTLGTLDAGVLCEEDEWYNCIKHYLNDLAVRKAGGG